jgi:hypothetical protein
MMSPETFNHMVYRDYKDREKMGVYQALPDSVIKLYGAIDNYPSAVTRM